MIIVRLILLIIALFLINILIKVGIKSVKKEKLIGSQEAKKTEMDITVKASSVISEGEKKAYDKALNKLDT